MSNTPTNLDKTPAQEPKSAPAQRPNELGTISVQAHMRIFDPNTNKTIVETRG